MSSTYRYLDAKGNRVEDVTGLGEYSVVEYSSTNNVRAVTVVKDSKQILYCHYNEDATTLDYIEENGFVTFYDKDKNIVAVEAI